MLPLPPGRITLPAETDPQLEGVGIAPRPTLIALSQGDIETELQLTPPQSAVATATTPVLPRDSSEVESATIFAILDTYFPPVSTSAMKGIGFAMGLKAANM